MIQKHSSKITMVHYTGLKGLGQFRQYVNDDVQQCNVVHEYEDKLTDDEYQWSEKILFNLRYSLPQSI
jgi:hypothetical protein